MVTVELKEINGFNMILVLEPFTEKIKDYIILSEISDNTKKLDKYFYDVILKRIKELFEDTPYNLGVLKNDLRILYGIKIDDSKTVDYSTSKLLKEIYLKLKYKDLSWYLDFLKKKITKEGQRKVIDAILKLDVNKETFDLILKLSNFTEIKYQDLIKEIKYLCMKESIKLSNKKIKEYEWGVNG